MLLYAKVYILTEDNSYENACCPANDKEFNGSCIVLNSFIILINVIISTGLSGSPDSPSVPEKSAPCCKFVIKFCNDSVWLWILVLTIAKLFNHFYHQCH